jgi:hypothetical protein
MPLEDLVGAKSIDALNADWPAGSDLPDAGDNHIRGIKNVLKRTFPNVTGPITLTQDQLNRGVVPVGTRTVFYMAAPPVGWQRVVGLLATNCLRVVATLDPGGVSGGTDDPVVNSKVAAHNHGVQTGTTAVEAAGHTHGISILTTGASVNHTHSGTTNVGDAAHSHVNGVSVSGGFGVQSGAGYALSGGVTGQTSIAHQHSFITSGQSADHAHSVSGRTGAPEAGHTHPFSVPANNNVGAASWSPRYLDVILCERV